MSRARDMIPLRLACHENLECLLSSSRAELFHCVTDEAAAYPLFRASLPARRLLPVRLEKRFRPFLNDWSVIRFSDLDQALKRVRASGFIPSYRSSQALEAWAQQAGLTILSPPAVTQRAFEDKLRFNRLLTENGLPVPASAELSELSQVDALKGYPLVVQVPASEGSSGTFLVRSGRQLRQLIRERPLKLPLLCRSYAEGAVLGVTLVVGAEQLILSAARYQCRGLNAGSEDLPGIQWAASERFSRAQRRALEKTLVALGRVLQQQGFRGAANIDLILQDERALLIECNPRFSAATPQLSLVPDLLHGLDFIAEYRRALAGQPLSANQLSLPTSRYEGTYVDLGDWLIAQLRELGRRVVHQMPELGVYDFSRGQLQLISQDVAELCGKHRALFYYSTPAGMRIGAKSDLGALLANAPLFDPGSGGATLNALGTSLIRQLQRGVRLAKPEQSLADLVQLSGCLAQSNPGAARSAQLPLA